jgi:hypothetical protein
MTSQRASDGASVSDTPMMMMMMMMNMMVMENMTNRLFSS